ncbi:MAG: hypothetical protein HY304_00710 [candidate division Zixibacteria bacterium]|nr:hypothetical protein [candidate division Zixibacteria bacterium]
MKRRLGAAAFAILIVLPCATSAAAGGNRTEDIPLGSWVYDAVFELSTQGHFETLLLHTRPYTRGEVTDAVRFMAGHSNSLSAGEHILLSRLQSEFAEELADTESHRVTPRDQTVRLGGGPTAHIDQFHEGYAKNRIGFDASGSFTAANRVTARMRLRVDSDGRQDSQFHGEYWREKFTAWVDQAVLTGQLGRFHAAFGREFWRWGPSSVDALLISDHSPPFDGLRLTYRAHNWSFGFMTTMLDPLGTDPTDPEEPVGIANRYLAGHLIDWRPRRNLELAISEVVVYGGVNRPWALNYLNPILPYYWEQLNNNDVNDNPLWNLEFSWRPLRHLEIYGEWMIDDFQIDFTSEPQQIGVLGGVSWSPRALDGRLFLNGEYERINTFVYGQGRSWNRYVHDRNLHGDVIGIGSDLGTDADRLTFRPRCHVSPQIDLSGLAESVRRGWDRIDRPQTSSVPKGVPFPSGIVERQWTLGLGLHGQKGGHIIIDVQGGYQKTQNVGHAMGVDRRGGYFQLRLACQWWRTFGV